MRQKYMIFRDRTQKKLNIKEYAIIDKDLKKKHCRFCIREALLYSVKKTIKMRSS